MIDLRPARTLTDMFTSRRERRLWTWVGVAMAGSYLSLGFANALASWAADTGLDAGLFLVGTALFVATAVSQGLQRKPTLAGLVVAFGITAVYVLLVVRLVSPVERSHLVEYGVVAILVHMALLERRANGAPVPVPALAAIGVTTVLGVVDEMIQMVLPNRVYDPIDILFNVIAVVAGVGLVVVVGRTRDRVGRAPGP